MKKGIVRLIICTGLVISGLSLSNACEFDTDCYPGSKCVKKGSLYGVCKGGTSPGNRYDSRPVYSPTDPNRTYGNTCSFNTDCGPGSVCVKGSGINGVCMRR